MHRFGQLSWHSLHSNLFHHQSYKGVNYDSRVVLTIKLSFYYCFYSHFQSIRIMIQPLIEQSIGPYLFRLPTVELDEPSLQLL